jgi:hypothetical protein
MSVIRVQGETYDTLDDLVDTIDELDDKLHAMPDGSAERMKLAAHVETLRAAAAESGGGESTASPAAPDESPPDEPPTEDEDEDVEHTHSLRDAAENGKEIVCPLCGSEIPFPEVPPLDPKVKRCDDCNGWGNVLTGSRVDGHVWRDCPTCNGSGFVDKQGAAVPVLGNQAAHAPEAPGAVWNAERENWSPPPGQQPPWAGAVWDEFLGKWS